MRDERVKWIGKYSKMDKEVVNKMVLISERHQCQIKVFDCKQKIIAKIILHKAVAHFELDLFCYRFSHFNPQFILLAL